MTYHLSSIKRFPEALPTMDGVKATILVLCPLDFKTGGVFEKDSVSSLCILARVLYLPHYREISGLADTPLLVSKCLMEIEVYLQHHKMSFFLPLC